MLKLSICIGLSVIFLTVWIQLNCPINPQPMSKPNVTTYENILNLNLIKAEHLFQDVLIAPEHLLLSPDNQKIYISLGDGRIMKMDVDGQKVYDWIRTGETIETCGDLLSESQCGRPLGMAFAPAKWYNKFLKDTTSVWPSHNEEEGEVLIVADAYKGLLLIDYDGNIKTLLDPKRQKNLNFPNSVLIGKNGLIYLTNSSERFKRNRVLYDILENGETGSLISFDPSTAEMSILLPDLKFPNGLAFADDGKSILIALTTSYEIIKYHLTGDSKHTTQQFCHLPGFPDNIEVIKQDGKEILTVGIGAKPNPTLSPLFSNIFLRRLLTSLLPYSVIPYFFKPYGIFAIVDLRTGNIEELYEDPTGKSPFLSGVYKFGNSLYLGSWKNHFLTRLHSSLTSLN